MTVDVATLVFEFKSDSAGQAEKAMDRLIQKGDQLDVTAKKVRLATDRVSEGHRGAAGAAERAASGATGLAAAEGAVEKATRSAAQASAAARQARQLEAAAMREVVVAYNQAERAAKEQAAAVATLRASVDPLAAAQDRVNAELAQANALYKAGAISATEYANAQRVLSARLNEVEGLHRKAGGSARLQAHEMANLGSQFADIGVSLASGQALWLVAIQQGAQIGGVYSTAAARGATLATVMGQLGGLAGNIAAKFAPLAVVIAAIGGAFLVATQQINEGNKDIAKGLGLTAEQLKKVKNDSVTMGDTVKATFQVVGGAIWAAIGGPLTEIGKAFKAFYDEMIRLTVEHTKLFVGLFVGAFDAVKATWSLLPRAMSDIGIQAANFVINAVEMMVNKSIAGLNKLIAFANAGAKAVGIDAQMKAMGGVDFGRIQNWDAGAAAKAGEVASAAFAGGVKKGGQMVDAAFGAITAQAVKNAQARIRKEAGEAKDGPKASAATTPRDQTDERMAQIAALLAQAMQDELQARLAITREAVARADIERQIAKAALMEKQAQVDKQIANIAYDVEQKRLTEAKGKELTDQLLIVQAMNGRTASIRDIAITEAMNAQLSRERYELQRTGIENEIDLLSAQADITQSAYARAGIEIEILKAQQQIERLKLEEVIASATSTATEKAIAQSRLNTLSAVHALELEQAKRQTRLVDAISQATSSVRGFKDAFKRHDWARVFDELQRTIQTIQASFKANGLAGGLMTAGSAAATMIGGKTGRAIGGGLGIAGAGISAGTGLMTAASMGMLGSGALAGGAMALAPLLGPIALAAGALYAAAKIFNVGGKPTNAGAGFDLRTGAISGNKRTEETEGAARSAGEAIQGIMDAVKAAGIGLTDAVTGLVIGTRDQTQIYLQSGKTLNSAVGDSGAAVDTAMRALLSSATYVSDAQKKLVDSALAAGKGFDAVAEILAAYEAAQNISKGLSDQILQLTDPKAFDLAGVSRDIEEQRKAYKALADQGYLTADQLLTINGQLSTLEGLKLAEVMKRYADSVDAANDNLSTLRSATESAEGMLMDAYNTYASAKKAEIDSLRQTAEGLKAFRKELNFGAIAGRNPTDQLAATRREFERLSAMDASNPERMANLQSVSQAFLEASRVASPTQLAFDRDLQAVRRATEASEMAATTQADLAQRELDAQTAAVGQLIQLNATSVSIAQGIANLLVARANEKAAGGVANDNLDVGRYLAMNPDLVANWNEGGIMRSLGGSLEEAVRAQYSGWGKNEVAKGLRGYAAGGDHPGGWRMVGEEGPELEATGPARIYSARDTARMMGGDNSRLEALVENLTETVAAQAGDIRALRNDNNRMLDQMKSWDGNGLYVRGSAPDEPVETIAA